MMQVKVGDTLFMVTGGYPSAVLPKGEVTKVTKISAHVDFGESGTHIFWLKSGKMKGSETVRCVDPKEAATLVRRRRKGVREEEVQRKFDYVIRDLVDAHIPVAKKKKILDRLKPLLPKEMQEELETLK